MRSVLVVGAGVGGLTTAALLAKAGLEVTVLEAHVYPGGCAATFPYQGYRFDAGATLAGGFYPGGPMALLGKRLGISWPTRPAEPAMVVHMPDGTVVPCWSDPARWREARTEAFGRGAEPFWRWQEGTADVLWELALRTPPWPPQGFRDTAKLAEAGLATLIRHPGSITSLASGAFNTMASQLDPHFDRLRTFLDGQLLISAQATSGHANALYGAAAIDLPRRGVVHLEGGMGAISQMLAASVAHSGGRVLYRQEALGVRRTGGRWAVETNRRQRFEADVLVANLTPWNLAKLLGEDRPAPLRRLPAEPRGAWGAFVLYLGLDGAVVPAGLPLHHQLLLGEPLGEGNSLFLSLSPEWDSSRAPVGRRAATISTHTRMAPWWQLLATDPEGYAERRTSYVEKLLAGAEIAIPGLRRGLDIAMPGTPVTFQRFTRRHRGWVGGFPQTGLLESWAPHLAPGLWMVGDSIFPGQSTAAAALGGMRVARQLLKDTGIRHVAIPHPVPEERGVS